MNRRRLLTLGFWLLAFGFWLNVSSCSSGKTTTKSSLRTYTANHIMREIEENNFEFENIQTRLDIKFQDDNNSIGLRGQLRMQRDSVIWLSLSLKVGIEIGRIMITPDSVMFMNRSNKTYLAESLHTFNEKLPIEPSIAFFQDILLGNDTQIKNGDRYRVTTENDRYRLEITKKDFNITEDLWVTPKTFKISKYNIKEQNNDKRNIHIEYDDFKEFDDRLMPSKIRFKLSSGHDVSVEINYSNVIVNEDVMFPFNITKKFDRISLW